MSNKSPKAMQLQDQICLTYCKCKLYYQ